MKKIVLGLAAVMLVFTFAACSKATKLKIENFSSFTLTNISFKGTSFSSLVSGDSDTQEVDSGNDYVFFDAFGSAFRTYYLVNAESHKTTSFAITDSTLVVPRQAGSRGMSGEAAPVALGSVSR